MRIVCLSDTHNRNEQIQVPDGDLLLHAGDATIRGTVDEISAFARWFGSLPHKHKVFVAGNHDWLFETSNRYARSLLPKSIVYLEDSAVEIAGIKIYGSPWQPRFYDWAFNLNRGPELAAKWKLIPPDTNILITHGPPHGILDEVPRRFFVENTGCEELRKRVEIVRPKLHLFGHIHCGYGQAEDFGVKFVNASNCDEQYEPSQPPIVVEIP
jgi:Icc-related predicted phosphoesterase